MHIAYAPLKDGLNCRSYKHPTDTHHTLLLLAALAPPLLAGLWFMPYVGSVSNCGGNNAARVYVREHVLVMTRFAEEGPYHRFSLAAARPAI